MSSQCSASAQSAFKNKIEKQPQMDRICPCDQHCFVATMTDPHENLTDLSATGKCHISALHNFLDIPKTDDHIPTSSVSTLLKQSCT